MLDEGQTRGTVSPTSLVHFIDNPIEAAFSQPSMPCESVDKRHVTRPLRPFSNPIKFVHNAIFDSSGLSPSEDSEAIHRPSSTPVNVTSELAKPNMAPYHLHDIRNTILDSSLMEDEPTMDSGYTKPPSVDFVPPNYFPSSQQDTPWDPSSVADTSISCDSPAVTVVSSVSQLLADQYMQQPSTPNLSNLFSPPSQPTSNLSDSRITPHGSTYRAQALKRPHSAVNFQFDSRDPEEVIRSTVRPSSAPKRLLDDIEEPISSLFVDGTTLSFEVPDSQLDIPQSAVDPAPKSTLEALVASDSPLLFFSKFSVDPEKDTGQLCDLFTPSSPPRKSRRCSSGYDDDDQTQISYTLDLDSAVTTHVDFLPTDAESDGSLNSNSVSSSKSMASLDLVETTISTAAVVAEKHSDLSDNSPKYNLSDSQNAADIILDGPASITTQLTAFVEAMRSYAAELCPVDCVIMLERCRPFNCDTAFMKYFREQYLCPILSNLNGGPPLNADFGRDAYTSLYSLHGFHWRKPLQLITWVPDTPIIYRILKQSTTLQHEERHATDRSESPRHSGTPGHELMQAAVHAFDTIDRARRGLCRQVQRHLILLAVSPINLDKLLEADSSVTPTTNQAVDGGPLENLRRRGVALSTFSPIRSPSLLKLYELVNGVPPATFYDRRWQTVALSRKLLNADSPEHRIVGPMAAAFHAQAEVELSLMEQRQHSLEQAQQNQLQQQQQQQHEQSLNGSFTNGHHLVNGTSHPSPHSPRQTSTQLQRHNTQTGNFHMPPTCASNFNATGSPNATLSRAPRNGSGSLTMLQNNGNNNTAVASINTGPGSYASRSSGPRSNTEVNRLSEHSGNPLSVGHSGPNSVDQQPGSVYGSDSVATPQGPSSFGLMSPQQSYGATNAVAGQLVSPAATPAGAAVGGVCTLPVTPGSMSTNPSGPPNPHVQIPIQYNPYGHPHQQQYVTAPGAGPDMSGMRTATGPPMSPVPGQIPFRPPSNANSPPSITAVPIPGAGLPSPSSGPNSSSSSGGRARTRQYSPQMISQGGVVQQQLQQPRRTSPHPGAMMMAQQHCPTNQSMRTHPLNSPDGMGVSGMPRNSSTASGNYLPGNNPSINTTQFIPSGYSTGASGNGVLVSGQSASIGSHHSTVSPGSRQQMGSQYHHPGYDPQTYRSPGSVAATVSNATAVYSQPSMTGSVSNCGGATTSRPTTLGFGPNGINGPPGYRDSPSGDANLRRMEMAGPHMVTTNQNQVQAMRRQQQMSPLEPTVCARSVLWEGEAQLVDQNASGNPVVRLNMRLILERTASRDISQMNMQLWGPTAQISVIHAHQDSAIVHGLSSSLPSGYLLAHVLVEIPQSEEACALITALSTRVSPVALPLGILSPPPSTMPNNMIPAGAIAFVCLTYNPKRFRVQGLIPVDSEQFRHDVATRQYKKPIPSATADGRSYSTGVGIGNVISRMDDSSMAISNRMNMPPAVSVSGAASSTASSSNSTPFMSSMQTTSQPYSQQQQQQAQQPDHRSMNTISGTDSTTRDSQLIPPPISMNQSYSGHYQPCATSAGTSSNSTTTASTTTTAAMQQGQISSNSYVQGPNSGNVNAKFSAGNMVTQQQQHQMMIQRDSASPHRCGGGISVMPDGPPPQWIGVQSMDPYTQQHQQQQQQQQQAQSTVLHQQRGMKALAQQQQAQAFRHLDFVDYTGCCWQQPQQQQRVASFGAMHTTSGQAYAFQPQLRGPMDRMSNNPNPGSGGSMQAMMVQLNEPASASMDHHSNQRNSPQLSNVVITTGQQQAVSTQSNAARFIPAGGGFTGMSPATGQFSYQQMTTAVPSQMINTVPSYVSSPQGFPSRNVYAVNNPAASMGCYPGNANTVCSASSTCYQPRALVQQAPTYRVLSDNSTPVVSSSASGMGFMSVPAATDPSSTSKHAPSTMDVSVYSTMPNRMSGNLANCSVVTMDMGGGGGGHFASGSDMLSSSQQSHMVHQPVYGVIRTSHHPQQQQHPIYDMCEPGTTPGFF